MYASLGEFVTALERAGELARIRTPVSPIIEIAAAADRESKAGAPGIPSECARRNDPRFYGLGGRALLFERVEGSEIPVLINALGSYRRMEMALGCNDAGPGLEAGRTPGGFDAIGARLGDLVKPVPPNSFTEAIVGAKKILPILRMPPKRRGGRGACQEVVWSGEEVDLTRLPLIRCWPHDGDPAAMGYPAGVNDAVPGVSAGDDWDKRFRGRYITFAGIHTIHADDAQSPRPASHNVGMYRVQLLGKRTMAMHWHMHHDGARHWRSWKARGKPMPVAIAFGGESVLPYAATAPLPPGMSELLLAGYLNGAGIEMVRGLTVPLWVPANAEIVIEGFVRPEAGGIGYDPRRDGPPGPGAAFEGPFGDHTGFYSLPDRYPLLEVTAVTMRRNPIFPATVVGLPPQEDYFMGKATERIFLPLLRTLIHDVNDYDLPLAGAFHNWVSVKITKSYPAQARRVMHSVWGAGQMAWTKTIFVVDEGVDVHDAREVLLAAGRHCDPSRDIEFVSGPVDILDHAAPRLGVGTKIGLDCTAKIAGEDRAGEALRAKEALTSEQQMGVLAVARGMSGVRACAMPEGCAGAWLFISICKASAGNGTRLLESLGASFAGLAARPRFVVVLGEQVRVEDLDESLFHWLANSDAGRDSRLFGDWIGFDATPKTPDEGTPRFPVRDWPPILRLAPEVQERAAAILAGRA